VPLLAVAGALGDGADRVRIPGIHTIAAEATAGDDRSLSVALIAVAWGLGNLVSPPLLGLIANRVSLSAAFVLTGSLTLLAAIGLYFRCGASTVGG
jgi:hypothetical protein